VKRLIGTALTLLGLLACTFAIGRLSPIDPVLVLLGDRADTESHQTARKALGLDEPLMTQMALHAKRALQGDLGISTLTARPVAEDLRRVFPATIELATLSLLIGFGLGVPLGLAGAYWHGRWPDHLARAVGLLGHSAPVFWLALMLLLFFYVWLGIAPGPGRIAPYLEGVVPHSTGFLILDAMLAGEWEAAASALSHLMLPALTLGIYALASIGRMTRSLVLDQLSQDFVLAARARGLSEWRVVFGHALGPALGPLASLAALTWGALLEGSVLTETVFAWPGLGSYLTNALLAADMAAVLGATLLIGVVTIGLNLAADLIQRRLDPRTA
jgi:peptide/nickel transport system permease protein